MSVAAEKDRCRARGPRPSSLTALGIDKCIAAFYTYSSATVRRPRVSQEMVVSRVDFE